MLQIIAVLPLALAVAVAAPPSESVAAETETAGRYVMNPVDEGMLRLDTRSGAISLCRRADQGWSCEAVPDTHLKLQQELDSKTAEIEALQQELSALKARLKGGRDAGTPGAERDAAKPGTEQPSPVPGEETVDQMMTMLEGMIRRFQDMMQSLERPPSEKQL